MAVNIDASDIDDFDDEVRRIVDDAIGGYDPSNEIVDEIDKYDFSHIIASAETQIVSIVLDSNEFKDAVNEAVQKALAAAASK